MKIKTQVTMDKGEIEQILLKHLESIGLKPESGIEFDVGPVYSGNTMREYCSYEFSGISFNTTIEK